MTPADIIAARERMGLTQARLADLLGVHTRTVCSWEQGRRHAPPFLRLAMFALENAHIDDGAT
jgi:DNA-binding transcriptional regulator YiaG